MMKLSLLLVFLLNFLFLSTFTISSLDFHVPRLSQTRSLRTLYAGCDDPSEFELYWYNQTIDHFNYRPESYETFQQRYFINKKYWKLGDNPNPNPPIFVYFGAELSLDYDAPCNEGFMNNNSRTYSALMVFIEHRYYWPSRPNGTTEEIMNNTNIRGYFNSAQALADYAEIILHVKQSFEAQDSPVLVVGGSYGGMLSSWFRLKYPHIAFGALASSAPILYFDDITPESAYDDLVTMAFREESESCYKTIKYSWQAFDRINATYGLKFLSEIFHTCTPLTSVYELKNFLMGMYIDAAQNNLPLYRIPSICKAVVDNSVGKDDDIGIAYALAYGVFAYKQNLHDYSNCTVNQPQPPIAKEYLSIGEGWNWQVCSEMVFPYSTGDDPNSMFEPSGPFDLTAFINRCIDSYGVAPRPHWVTTYYGGHDISTVLRKFGSNIIFSNGLRDPYSVAGVLANISDTIVAVTTEHGTHCLDLYPPDLNQDPDWLTEQRQIENKIIQEWLVEYYNNLPKAVTMPTPKTYFI